jgi:hypothetical protein
MGVDAGTDAEPIVGEHGIVKGVPGPQNNSMHDTGHSRVNWWTGALRSLSRARNLSSCVMHENANDVPATPAGITNGVVVNVRLPVMNARYAVPWTSCGVA